MNTATKTLILACLAAVVLAPAVDAKHTITATGGDPTSGTYTLNVDVANFNLVPFAGKSAVKGEGHIHYLVNDKDACSAQKADCKAPTDYATTSKSFTFTNLKAGDKITAELVLSDHSASGTDANSNLDGSRVLSAQKTVVAGKSSPGVGIFVIVALLGIAFVARRK